MDVLVHARVCKGSGGLLGLRRYLWIPGYKKRDTIYCSNYSGKYYSYSSGARYAMSRSYEKGTWSRNPIFQ
nr:30S ribosomal protein S11, chloroplastic [Tanacetum cinerariifolium]